MATRKRKQDEELVALPSDESEEEEEYVSPSHLFTAIVSSSRIDTIVQLHAIHLCDLIPDIAHHKSAI